MSCSQIQDPNNDHNSGENSPRRAQRESKMFIYIREIIFVFTLIFTSYATFYQKLPKMGKPPTPAPFFPATSVVPDFYRGSMSAPFYQVSQAELAVILFYAPWDAASQRFRADFDIVAKFYRDQAYFAAVSCWAPNSECRQNHPKIRRFPVVVLYPQNGNGIQYKGPLKSAHLISFIKKFMRPLHRIGSFNDIINLFDSHEAVVVGSFEFLGNLGGHGFFTFYSTALRYLEADFSGSVAFGVTTSITEAKSLQIEAVPSITLYLWNETHTFSPDAKYNEETVLQWISEKCQVAAPWVHLTGLKSTALKSYLSQPTLIVFTPRNPLFSINSVFVSLQEIVLRYKNSNFGKLFDFYESLNKRIETIYKMQKHRCRKIEKVAPIVTSSIVIFSPNGTNDCDASFFGPKKEICLVESHFEPNITKLRYRNFFWYNEFDSRGPESLLNKFEADNCQLLDVAYRYQKPVFVNHQKDDNLMQQLNGLEMKMGNKSLNFILMDSLNAVQIAEAFGLDLSQVPNNTSAVLVDVQDESQYILREPFTQSSLTKFILNHANGNLVRNLRSTTNKKISHCEQSENLICVPELHSENFLSTINSKKAVVVLFHSPFCGMCRSISHIFLLLARYFRFFNGLLFVRIDGENNDLPWKFTMDIYPTVLFVPTFDKGESRVFGENLPFNVKNLMNFVLSNLEPEAKVAAFVSLCLNFDPFQTKEEARKCKGRITREIQDGLARNLKMIRKNLARAKTTPEHTPLAVELHRQKTRLMYSLQFFRTSGFFLMQVERVSEKSVAMDIFQLYHRFIWNFPSPVR